MIEIVVKFLLNMIFGEEKRAKIRHFGAKNCLMSRILPILLRLVFHEMPNSCIFKKSRIWQVFLYMTWYGKHIRKKYRWRQVLWADALIQMPRKTPERNPVPCSSWYITRTMHIPQVPCSSWYISYATSTMQFLIESLMPPTPCSSWYISYTTSTMQFLIESLMTPTPCSSW